MKQFEITSYMGDSTDYNESVCIRETKSGEYVVTPCFSWDEDDEDHEITGYYAFSEGNDEPLEFETHEKMKEWMESYTEELNAAERSKWICLKRNAKKRLHKDLAVWVKNNARMMGWPVNFFRNACLLAVSHYEVSIDEVMNRELMFAV